MSASPKYLLPIGDGADQIVNAYRVKGGLLQSGASGGSSWNPLESGQTFLQVRPFYRAMQINGDDVDSVQRTNGLDFNVYWDNRDFTVNPSKGNSLQLKVSRDFGWANSSNPWTVYSTEYDQYFSLGPSDTFRQRVIALDFWTVILPPGRSNPTARSPTGPRPFPAPRLAVCSRCAAIRPRASATRQASTTERNTA